MQLLYKGISNSETLISLQDLVLNSYFADPKSNFKSISLHKLGVLPIIVRRENSQLIQYYPCTINEAVCLIGDRAPGLMFSDSIDELSIIKSFYEALEITLSPFSFQLQTVYHSFSHLIREITENIKTTKKYPEVLEKFTLELVDNGARIPFIDNNFPNLALIKLFIFDDTYNSIIYPCSIDVHREEIYEIPDNIINISTFYNILTTFEGCTDGL